MRCTVLFTLVSFASSGNVLIFNPTYGNSHVYFMGNIADILVRDGHNVTVFSPIARKGVILYGTKEDGIHKVTKDLGRKTDNLGISIISDSFWTQQIGNRALPKSDLDGLQNLLKRMITVILEDEYIMNTLKRSNFDLVISEVFHPQVLVLFEALGIKSTIIASSLGMTDPIYEVTGLPMFPSYVTDMMLNYGEKKTFWERLDSLVNNIESHWLFHSSCDSATTFYRKYLPELPPLDDLLKKRVSLVFSNVNEFTETPRPQSNMVKYIGGMHIKEPKPLSKEFDELLNLRPSTVLVSLGTFAKTCTMPDFMKQEFLQAFSSFPDTTFLWKYENCVNDSIAMFPPNVIALEWMPQSDLLADPRVKTFVTHGGMNSLLEAIVRGMPLVAIPLFGDQYPNTRNAESRGHAIRIPKTEVTADRLISALKQTLDPDGPIAKKARQMAAVAKGSSERQREAIARWTRLVIDYGHLEHLPLRSRDMSFVEVYSLDCVMFLLACFVIVTIGVVCVGRVVFKLITESVTFSKIKNQ